MQRQSWIWDNLPESIRGNELDDDLDRVLRVAAVIGARSGDDSLVSFSSIACALLLCDDEASRWFQDTVGRSGRREAILRGREAILSDRERILEQADSMQRPAEPRNRRTVSATGLLESAKALARGAGPIGVRHLLAAYGFAPPSGHDQQVRDWGFTGSDWREAFRRFVGETPLGAELHRRSGSNPKHSPSSEAPGREMWSSSVGSSVARNEPDLATDLPKVATRLAETGNPTEKVRAAVAEPSANRGESMPKAPAGESASPQPARPSPFSIAGFTPDSASSHATDHFGIEPEAEAFARVAASKALVPPISFGVFGEWGSGKTFFMEKMHAFVTRCADSAAVAAKRKQPTAYHADIVQIRFNAWHYMETNLWASLVDHIFRKLDDWLQAKQEQEQIKQLYSQLSTARTLKLEALDALIAVRRRRRAAEQRLQAKRSEQQEAESRGTRITAADFWSAVVDVGGKDLKEKHKATIDAAIVTLGLRSAKESASNLFAAIEQARDSSRRAGVLWRSAVARAGSWGGAVLLIVFVLGVPMAFALGIVWLGKPADGEFFRAFVETIRSPLLALSGSLAGASGWIGAVVRGANDALGKVEVFQSQLDAKLEERRKENGAAAQPNKVLELQADIERRREESALAEQELKRADEQVAVALQGFQETARVRLHRFIREKIADGDYAKHLGIIATIRRDFEQLAQIMADERRETEAAREFEAERKAYAARLAAFEVDKLERDLLLTQSEAKELKNERDSCTQGPQSDDLRFFRRIVLYIDDLDRCPPDKVVDVLQACHLLLCFPLFVVVVAVDARWVSRALLKRFDGLLEIDSSGAVERAPGNGSAGRRVPEAGASPRDYLEKVFQIPFWVRRIQGDASSNFVWDLASAGQVAAKAPRSGRAAAEAGKRKEGRVPASAAPAALTPEEAASSGASRARAAAAAESTDGETASGTGASGAADDGGDQALRQQAEVPARAIDPNPASLQLTSHERDAMSELAPFAGDSPRSLKRFVNVYRILRTSLSEGDAESLVGDRGEKLDYSAILAQLAIVTGAPSIADAYFGALKGVGGSPTSVGTPSALALALEQNGSLGGSPEWESVRGPLAWLSKRHDTNAMIVAMRNSAPLVKRYSFSAGGSL